MANPKGNPQNLKPWPKGVSGNPSGHDNNRKTIDTIVREFLERTTEAKINGKVQEVKNLDLMLEAQLRKSISHSDTKAFEALMNRAYGKAKETIELANREGEAFRTENLIADDKEIIKRYLESQGSKSTKE